MSKGAIIALVIVGLIIVLVGSVIIYGISTYNSCNTQEKGITAVDRDMQNVHASIFSQIKSQGLAVEKYGEMVIQAIEVAMSGRYGKTGSQAAFQWLSEQNPSISPQIMEKLQVAIEAGYNKFEATQRTKIDRIRIYETDLGAFPKGMVAKMFGYPKIDLDELKQVIVTAETKKVFETKEMEVIDPFSK